jgi:hypothetical protein
MDTKIDFVIPLHRMHPVFRCTVEAIIEFYSPPNIYIITPFSEIKKINWSDWNTQYTTIHSLAEDLFFEPISKSDLETFYTHIDENSREYGWWYQQLLKMGATTQIAGLSEPYMVWDSDLIPITRWEIYPTEEYPHYRFAILQETARSQWNQTQYKDSIFELIGMNALEPEEGTFVPHHFIMYKSVLEELFAHIERKSGKPWFLSILLLSKRFWRFSEYKCIATFMSEKKPELLHYHPFPKYGNGLRFRDSREIYREIMDFVLEDQDVSYDIILEYIGKKWDIVPTYLQLEHL